MPDAAHQRYIFIAVQLMEFSSRSRRWLPSLNEALNQRYQHLKSRLAYTSNQALSVIQPPGGEKQG